MHMTYVAAAIAGCFAAWVWHSEAPDRDQERKVRRAQLVSDSWSVIVLAQDRGSKKGEREALESLVELGIPVDENNFDRFYLYGADLRGMSAMNSTFIRANLVYSTLTFSSLRGADFSQAELSASDFSNADLYQANFSPIRIMSSISFDNSCLARSNFSNGIIYQSSFRNAALYGASFRDTTLWNVDFKNAVFKTPMTVQNINQTPSVRRFRCDEIVVQDDIESTFSLVTTNMLSEAQGQPGEPQNRYPVVDFSGSTFDGVDLRNTDLRATNITQSQIDKSCVNEATKLPSSVTSPGVCIETEAGALVRDGTVIRRAPRL